MYLQELEDANGKWQTQKLWEQVSCPSYPGLEPPYIQDKAYAVHSDSEHRLVRHFQRKIDTSSNWWKHSYEAFRLPKSPYFIWVIFCLILSISQKSLELYFSCDCLTPKIDDSDFQGVHHFDNNDYPCVKSAFLLVHCKWCFHKSTSALSIHLLNLSGTAVWKLNNFYQVACILLDILAKNGEINHTIGCL